MLMTLTDPTRIFGILRCTSVNNSTVLLPEDAAHPASVEYKYKPNKAVMQHRIFNILHSFSRLVISNIIIIAKDNYIQIIASSLTKIHNHSLERWSNPYQNLMTGKDN